MNYEHFRGKNAKFHIFLLLSIMGGISLMTINIMIVNSDILDQRKGCRR